ncbi:DNA binding domain-containing protein [Arthrobacter crystallopoietes BAB-32]|uniref:DNA binding domain-containing protein n=1 Tax=Arthrobacter crystallopoietes BAB-32 TaxID=1246476 RepID=N1VBF9_9MICC|nr:helix-turn-helix domain-containing protein [Arthrobacter crystallopoietes]EMY35638.1 DNA binding domain-containing protein [Arthrobacter crystallopoietes BAB-32]
MAQTPVEQRFLKLTQVQDELQISSSQAYALVRSGELPAIRIGGRNQWRVEKTKLEEYIQDAYRRTSEAIEAGRLPVEEPGDEPD